MDKRLTSLSGAGTQAKGETCRMLLLLLLLMLFCYSGGGGILIVVDVLMLPVLINVFDVLFVLYFSVTAAVRYFCC